MKMWKKILSVLLAVSLLCCLPICPIKAAAAGSASTIQVKMSDSYGDGWNGNKVEVYVDGVYSTGCTFSSGSSATSTISYDSAKTYEFKWYKGSYPYECSFEIVVDGQALYTATTSMCSGYTTGQSLYVMAASNYDLEGEFAGGSGTTVDPYLVATKAQLDNVRDYPSAHFRQVRDIAFTTSDFAAGGDFYNDGNGWEPIGTVNNVFYGSYDGNGRKISGLTITGCETRYVGLFGYFAGSVVNLEMENLSYTLNGGNIDYIGGIVGGGYNGEIVGCTVSGQIQCKSDAGGIAGDVYIVKHCISNVTITVTDNMFSWVGGIVGSADEIIGCENHGNITVSGGQANAGGIAGYASGLVSDCKNTASITAETVEEYDTVNVGGIVGEAYSSDVTKCENTGAVRGVGFWTNVGGIVGRLDNSNASITQCVNKAAVSGAVASGTNVIYSSMAGGIVGEIYSGTVENCYVTSSSIPTSRGTYQAYAGGIAGTVWDDATVTSCYSAISSVSVNTSASGWGRGGIAGASYGTITNSYYYYTYGVGYNGGSGSVSRVSSLSTFANQSTYYNFNFSSVWEMGTGSYTYAVLRMEKGHAHSLTRNAATVTHEASGNLEHWYCASCETYFRNAAGTQYTTEDMLKADPLPRTGTCGTGVNWELTYEGVLAISGSGDMANYTSGTAPWYAYREKVKKLVVQEAITGIGNYAFQDCANLTNVKLPESITAIGNYAFSGCSAVTNLLLPESVKAVGDGAFAQITKLVLCFTGDAPGFAGENVFANTTVTAYYLVDKATWTEAVRQFYGGTTTWKGIASQEDAVVASGEMSYAKTWKLSVAGTLTITGDYSTKLPDYSDSTKPEWEAYKDQITALVLQNIERVGNYNFDDYIALEKVDLGEAYQIGKSAFEGCTALKKVYIPPYYFPSSYDNNNIEAYAFYRCTALEEVAFSGYATIGSYAFGHCGALKDVYIANYGSTYMPITNYLKPSENSFSGVTATVHLPGDWELYTANNYGGALTWEHSDFGLCGADACWSYDAATATVMISGTGEIVSLSTGSNYPWYSYKSGAEHLVIEDGISGIPAYAFEYMGALKTVRLPNTLQQLSCNAFNDCKSMNNLIIPASVTGFASGYYFNRCDSLTDIYYMGTAEEWAGVANNSVVGNSYDNIERVHFLTLHEGSATCTEGGTQSYYTFDDTSVYSDMFDLQKNVITTVETIPATGHSIVHHEAKVPSCTEIGWNAYETCENCDHSTYAELPAAGHSIVTCEAKAPTCTEIGWNAYEACENCDYSTYAEIPSSGHSIVTYEAKAPTCTEIGWNAYEACENCDHSTYTELPASGHSYEGDICTVCSKKKVDIQITNVTLRPSCSGLYFKGSFAFDEEVAVSRYGIAVSLYNELPVADNSDFSSIYTEGYNSVLISSILSGSGTNGETLIYARPYALLEDGTYIYGDVVATNLKMVVQVVDTQWDGLTTAQQEALADMYRKHSTAMQNWQIPKIKAFA